MKKLLLAMALLTPFMSSSAWASMPTQISSADAAPVLDTKGLSEEQLAQMQRQADELRKASPEAQTDETIERVQKYVEVGKGIGAGLGEAARSMGVAVNDFASTPVGRLTTFVIIWKVLGEEILGVLGGVLWFSTMLPLWVFYFRRICLHGAIEETFDPESGKLIKRNTAALPMYDDAVSGYRMTMLFVLAGICATGFIMVFG